jgi:DNA-binding NarL/FixJ family response regulator
MRVALGDDSILLREGVSRLLVEAGFEVVAQAGDAEGLLREVDEHRPDVAIVDIRMPPGSDGGLSAARDIRSRFPNVGVLVLSQYARPSYAFELLSDSAEAMGYLLKDRVSDVAELSEAVRRVGAGGTVLDPVVVAQLVGRPRQGDMLEELTDREREVLALMAEGRSNVAIGERLFITERTVEKHVTNIFDKLMLPLSPDDHRRVLAVLAFLRM